MKRRTLFSFLIMALICLLMPAPAPLKAAWPMYPRIEQKTPSLSPYIPITPLPPDKSLSPMLLLPAKEVKEQKGNDVWHVAKVKASGGTKGYLKGDFKGPAVSHFDEGTLLLVRRFNTVCQTKDRHFIRLDTLMMAGSLIRLHEGKNLAGVDDLEVFEYPDFTGRTLVVIPKGRELGPCLELSGGVTCLQNGFARSSDIRFGD